MDYVLINEVIGDIIKIVNAYNKDKNYDYSVTSKLVIVLLGYYLTFGPEIFEKINKFIFSLNIYECESYVDYREAFKKILPEEKWLGYYLAPLPQMRWDFRYNKDNKFIGAIPNILYVRRKYVSDVLNLAHEISNGLEGLEGRVISEDDKQVTLRLGFSTIKVDKNTNFMTFADLGFNEFATINVENRVLQSLKNLEAEKIDYDFVKNFLNELSTDKKIVASGYPLMTGVYRNLMDNDHFFDLLKKYHYANDYEMFKVEYEGINEGLSAESLRSNTNILIKAKAEDTFDILPKVTEQINLFNEGTNFKADTKSLILLV